eukprot:996322-Pleurochrysis_carterae.AAC.3
MPSTVLLEAFQLPYAFRLHGTNVLPERDAAIRVASPSQACLPQCICLPVGNLRIPVACAVCGLVALARAFVIHIIDSLATVAALQLRNILLRPDKEEGVVPTWPHEGLPTCANLATRPARQSCVARAATYITQRNSFEFSSS